MSLFGQTITGSFHTLPFDKMSPRDFERMCLWLIEREGYNRAEHLGAAGNEQGRDIVAWRGKEQWAFQCKRVHRFGPQNALREVHKVLGLPDERRPIGIVFLVTCDVSDNTREQVRARCQVSGLAVEFWTGTELDEKVKQHTDILAEFFRAGSVLPGDELQAYMARAVAIYESRMYQRIARRPSRPSQPYKFLYAFDVEDSKIFFGRENASEILYQTILNNRLTVLHARSGEGKTSLLNAGLLPRLIYDGRLPVYARTYEDPTMAIKRTIAPPSSGAWPASLHRLSLHEFLGLATSHVSRQTQEIVVILDQFEEFFVFWPQMDHRRPFINMLGDIYDDESLPVRLVISVRKDYYSDLADLQPRIPNVFLNEYRLGLTFGHNSRGGVSPNQAAIFGGRAPCSLR